MPLRTLIRPVVLHERDIAEHVPEQFSDLSIGGEVSWRTLISQPKTLTDTFTVGVARCPPGKHVGCPAAGQLKNHRHTHAEMYHVISGKGLVTIDGVGHVVGKGSVVFIPGDAEHGMKCVGDEDVRWLYVFAADGFGDIVYRFSGGPQGDLEESIPVKAKL